MKICGFNRNSFRLFELDFAEKISACENGSWQDVFGVEVTLFVLSIVCTLVSDSQSSALMKSTFT